MVIGVPRERMDGERRVALIPAGANLLAQDGHRVLVEASAGEGAGFTDRAYEEAGASIVAAPADIWREADLIVKVKDPLPEECDLICPGQILFAFLHLASNRLLAETLLQKRVTALAYEMLEDPPGAFPLLAPMSEIAGSLAVQIAARYLQVPFDGPGLLLGGTAWVPPAHVVILGGGTAGTAAARAAIGLGARVTLLEVSPIRVQRLNESFDRRLSLRLSSPDVIDELAPTADVMVGAVLRPGDRAPVLVQRTQVERMQPGRVIVDIAIDQGGCFETSRPTSHSAPVFRLAGVCHYCVPNMPGAVPRTATLALTSATLPWVRVIADCRDVPTAARQFAPLERAVSTADGRLVQPIVARALSQSPEFARESYRGQASR